MSSATWKPGSLPLRKGEEQEPQRKDQVNLSPERQQSRDNARRKSDSEPHEDPDQGFGD